MGGCFSRRVFGVSGERVIHCRYQCLGCAGSFTDGIGLGWLAADSLFLVGPKAVAFDQFLAQLVGGIFADILLGVPVALRLAPL